MYKIFLSYRRNDLSGEQVALIHTTLEKEFGKRSTFWDKHMQGASQWERILRESSSSAKVCLILIGSNWNEVDKGTNKSRMFNFDDWVRIEIELAINNGLVVIPVLINGAKLPHKSEIPDSIWKIYERNAIVVETNRWEIYGDKLVNELKSITPPTPFYKKYLLPFAILVLLGLCYYIYSQYNPEHCEVSNKKFQIGYSEKISTFNNQLNSGMYSGAPGSPMKQIKANLLSSLDLIKQYTSNKTIQADIDSVMNNIEELTYDFDKRYYTVTEEMKSNLLNLSNAFGLYKDNCEWKFKFIHVPTMTVNKEKVNFSTNLNGVWINSIPNENTTHRVIIENLNNEAIVKLYSKSDFLGNKEFKFKVRDSLSILLDSIYHPNKIKPTNIYTNILMTLDQGNLNIEYDARIPGGQMFKVRDVMKKQNKALFIPNYTTTFKFRNTIHNPGGVSAEFHPKFKYNLKFCINGNELFMSIIPDLYDINNPSRHEPLEDDGLNISIYKTSFGKMLIGNTLLTTACNTGINFNSKNEIKGNEDFSVEHSLGKISLSYNSGTADASLKLNLFGSDLVRYFNLREE